MKVYTRTGDTGKTSLVGGTRVSKASPRLEAYGTVDELNSHLGVLLSLEGLAGEDRAVLEGVQQRLFNLGSRLATEESSPYQPDGVTDADITAIEAAVDRITAQLPAQFRFVLPGGTTASAQAHVARTVARRCERCMVEMADAGIAVDPTAMRFINRLSDYLFVLARHINISAGVNEIFWEK